MLARDQFPSTTTTTKKTNTSDLCSRWFDPFLERSRQTKRIKRPEEERRDNVRSAGETKDFPRDASHEPSFFLGERNNQRQKLWPRHASHADRLPVSNLSTERVVYSNRLAFSPCVSPCARAHTQGLAKRTKRGSWAAALTTTKLNTPLQGKGGKRDSNF